MNKLAIDYGTKNIGLAYSINGIIFTLPIIKNDSKIIDNLQKIIDQYKITGIYVGISEGHMANLIMVFVSKLKRMLKLPVETVEEAVSTIEATSIRNQNGKTKKKRLEQVDSVAAAVILKRVIN